jgi:hypothetical protein
MVNVAEIRETLEIMRTVAPSLNEEELRTIQIILYTALKRLEKENEKRGIENE